MKASQVVSPGGAGGFRIGAARSGKGGADAAPKIWSRPKAASQRHRFIYFNLMILLLSLIAMTSTDHFFVAPDRVDEGSPGPEMLPHEVTLALLHKFSHVDRALALDETYQASDAASHDRINDGVWS